MKATLKALNSVHGLDDLVTLTLISFRGKQTKVLILKVALRLAVHEQSDLICRWEDIDFAMTTNLGDVILDDFDGLSEVIDKKCLMNHALTCDWMIMHLRKVTTYLQVIWTDIEKLKM